MMRAMPSPSSSACTQWYSDSALLSSRQSLREPQVAMHQVLESRATSGRNLTQVDSPGQVLASQFAEASSAIG